MIITILLIIVIELVIKDCQKMLPDLPLRRLHSTTQNKSDPNLTTPRFKYLFKGYDKQVK